MKKGQITKESIIEKAAPIFNKLGYAGASMSALMQATGLQKGGIYNHFKTKEEIILQSFEYAIKKYNKAVFNVYKNEQTALSKLRAIVNFYRTYPLNPVIEGGCPIVNTAIDADNTLPQLKVRVKEVINNWIKNLSDIIHKGIVQGEIKSSVNAHDASVVIITALQGGIVISRSFEDNASMEIVVNKLLDYINFNLAK